MSTPTPTTSAMETAAEQYAFYVHGAKVAQQDLERFTALGVELKQRNVDIQSSIDQATSALTELQKRLRGSKAEFEGYEAHESAKLEALKNSTMSLVSEQREKEIILKLKWEEIEVRERDCKKQELVTRVAVAEVAKSRGELTNDRYALVEKEKQLSAMDTELVNRKSDLVQKEETLKILAEKIATKQKTMDTARESLATSLSELDGKMHDLAGRESVLEDGMKRLQDKTVALEPVLQIATEFKKVAIQNAGDSEKVKAWLEAHCV